MTPTPRDLVAVAAALGAAAIPPTAAAQSAEDDCSGDLLPVTSERTDKSFDAVKAVVVKVDVGSIKVVGAERSTTSVRTLACYSTTKPTLTQEVRDGVLEVTSRCERPFQPISLGFDRCSRDVTIEAPSGVRLTAKAGVGDVEARSLAGVSAVESDVGRASAVAMRADRVTATSGSGSASVESVVIPAEVAATAGTGDVKVTVPPGAYAIDAKADVGEVEVTGVQADPAAPRKITGKSDTGDVRISAGPAAAPVAGTTTPAGSTTRPAGWPTRAAISDVLRRGIRVPCEARAAGTCRLEVAHGRRTVAAGERRVGKAGTVAVVARVTTAGRRLLTRAQRQKRTLRLTAVLRGPGLATRKATVTARP
jgi:hypothetical protein